MSGRKKPLSKRSQANRHKVSITCRSGGHGFCSGQVFLHFNNHGRPVFGRCQCSCHRGGT